MSPPPRARRIAVWLIRAACRQLPADTRAEQCREWTAELPAILDDQNIRPPLRRALRALTFSVGICTATRKLSRPARAGSRRTANAQWRTGAIRARPPDVAVRAVLGFLIWLAIVAAVITLGRTIHHPPGWLVTLGLALAVGFDAFCLIDIARATQVRYLPKWAWTLICLIQNPLGGIMYLSIGHISRPRPLPPGNAKP
jgi:hypothetical protein